MDEVEKDAPQSKDMIATFLARFDINLLILLWIVFF